MVICLTSSHRIRSFSTYGFHDNYKSKVTGPNVPSQPGIPTVLYIYLYTYIMFTHFSFPIFSLFTSIIIIICLRELVESRNWPLADTARSYIVITILLLF